MSWTHERIATLRKMWLEGCSANQIAKQVGGVSRSAVIGKVHRLGLSGRAAPSQPARPAFKAPRSAARTMPSAPRRVIVAEPAPLPAVAQKPSVPASRVDEPGVATVLSPGAHMCKWPIGHPGADGFGFCDRGATGTYCDEHTRVAYMPKPPRDKTVTGNRKLPLWARS